jgi:hypothetical protein
MLSRKHTKPIAIAAAALVLAGGSYGILGAVSSSGSGSANAASSTAVAGTVVPFRRGEPTPSKVVGEVPPNWSPGSGTLVTGTAATKATAAALAAYPGGKVDRVVAVGGGDYNVHVIGVNWPHHVFLDGEFKVIGAE